MKVLIVDDHTQTATAIARMIEFWGHSAIEAYNAEDGIKLTKSEHPDLIILDMVMEGKDGYYFLEKITYKKIIVMSGFKINKEKLKKYKNIVKTIKKPIDFEELENIIKKLR